MMQFVHNEQSMEVSRNEAYQLLEPMYSRRYSVAQFQEIYQHHTI